MNEVAVIGAPELVAGFVLAGARVYPVSDGDQAREAWEQLPPSVAVVILSEPAARAIGDARLGHAAPLSVGLPA